MSKVFHTIPPFFHADSRILILGSLPSVASRRENFYYAHPQNRFWAVLSALFGSPPSKLCDVPSKKAFLASHGIALWDVIYSCDISASSDSSIKDAVPNDIPSITSKAPISIIAINGGKATSLYKKLIAQNVPVPYIALPSTSPANARFSTADLVASWSEILYHLT